MDVNRSFEAVDEFQKQAMDFVTSPRVREAFDYDSEPAAVKKRYGYPQPWTPRMGQAGARFANWNQRFLLARRLVEAGARRQKWIDQAQSTNLWLGEPDARAASFMYREAWERGLKTTYYLRSLGATSTEKSTISDGALNAVSALPSVAKAEPKQCLIDNPSCEACQ